MLLIDMLKAQENFSDTEKVISNYMLANLKQIPEMNITTLADHTFCSVATISRFCKKLKCSSFNTFKVQLAQEVSSNAGQQRVEYNFPFPKDADANTIASSIYDLSGQTLSDVYHSLDLNSIQRAAELLHKASMIDIYGSSSSLTCAMDLYYKLLWIHKNASLESENGFPSLKSQVHTDGTVAIVFSFYGIWLDRINLVSNLTKAGTPYILITGPKLNPLCVSAAEVIHVTPDEDEMKKIGPIASRIAMTYVSDLLYSLLFAKEYDQNIETVGTHIDVIKKTQK